jgi:hypothetical protein
MGRSFHLNLQFDLAYQGTLVSVDSCQMRRMFLYDALEGRRRRLRERTNSKRGTCHCQYQVVELRMTRSIQEEGDGLLQSARRGRSCGPYPNVPGTDNTMLHRFQEWCDLDPCDIR